MPTRPRIAVLVESSRGYGRGLLQGITAYVREHGPWTVDIHERRLYDAAPEWLRHWHGDGIIARLASRQFARQISRLRLPTVDLVGLHPIKDVPVIITDHRAVARLAADHLLSLGLRHFAFCGFAGIYYSEKRSQYFAEYLAERGFAVHVYTAGRRTSRLDASALEAESLPRPGEMAAWLKSLPKPAGLMAVTDNRGHQVLNVCGQHAVAVPDDVAVIGVDNDEMLCDLCDPPLSSVALNPWRVGYEGAALLDRMMKGKSPRRAETLIPPLGVVTRKSTDVLTIADADLAAALRLIRQHACDGLTIDDVVSEVHVSRSTLKRRFAAVLRRSPNDEIRRVQIEHVMRLLSTTKLPLAKIAALAGFLHVESMSKLFKKKAGMTPGQYRRLWSEQGVRGG
jgi:LacI family transcriptional regulator